MRGWGFVNFMGSFTDSVKRVERSVGGSLLGAFNRPTSSGLVSKRVEQSFQQECLGSNHSPPNCDSQEEGVKNLGEVDSTLPVPS